VVPNTYGVTGFNKRWRESINISRCECTSR